MGVEGVGLTKYSASDVWPEHPKSYWNDALALARSHSWNLVTFSGHSWGRIRCASGECAVLIFSTGRGGESVAGDAQRMIERCRHGPGGDPLVDIAARLDKAERLTDAAEHLIAAEHTLEAAEMLDSADSIVDEAALWGEFQELVDQASEHEDSAAAAFKDALEPPSTSGSALAKADSHVHSAHVDLKKQRSTLRRVKDLKLRASTLRDRIAQLMS